MSRRDSKQRSKANADAVTNVLLMFNFGEGDRYQRTRDQIYANTNDLSIGGCKHLLSDFAAAQTFGLIARPQLMDLAFILQHQMVRKLRNKMARSDSTNQQLQQDLQRIQSTRHYPEPRQYGNKFSDIFEHLGVLPRDRQALSTLYTALAQEIRMRNSVASIAGMPHQDRRQSRQIQRATQQREREARKRQTMQAASAAAYSDLTNQLVSDLRDNQSAGLAARKAIVHNGIKPFLNQLHMRELVKLFHDLDNRDGAFSFVRDDTSRASRAINSMVGMFRRGDQPGMAHTYCQCVLLIQDRLLNSFFQCYPFLSRYQADDEASTHELTRNMTETRQAKRDLDSIEPILAASTGRFETKSTRYNDQLDLVRGLLAEQCQPRLVAR